MDREEGDVVLLGALERRLGEAVITTSSTNSLSSLSMPKAPSS